jgi:TolA-binding protein
MENIGNKRRLLRWVCAFAVLSGSLCFAGDDEPTPGELLRKAGQQVKTKKYKGAIDTMHLYLDMVDQSTAQGVIRIAQDLRFKLITLLIEIDRLDDAVPVLQDYIDKPLGEYPRLARSMLATCLFATTNYADCVVAVSNALRYNEDPSCDAGRRVLTPDEIKQYAGYDEKGTELEYKSEDVTASYMTMAEAYYKLDKWNECLDPYQYVAEHTLDSQHKGYAIMQMINAMVAIPDFDRIAQWIPELYRTPARYDIRVNMALMKVAAALYNEGLFDDALPLYRMILPREEILAYQEGRLREMRIEHELPPEEGMEVSEGEKALFGIADKSAAAAEEGDAESDEVVLKPREIIELEKLLLNLKNLPPYELDNKYRMAQIYDRVERFWESVKFLDMVYTASPESEMGEYSIYQMIETLLENLDELADAEVHGFEYLKQHLKGLRPRMVAYLFTSYYQKHSDMEAIKALRPYLDDFVRAKDDERITRYDSELYYMQAVADLILFKFAESEKSFKFVVDEFPGSRQEGNSLYWYGMSKLYQNRFADAYEVLEEYGQRFSHEGWVDEASYQGGVCQFGLENYVSASNRFNHVISTYPNPDPHAKDFTSIFPDACTMRGDLLGASGELDDAETDYRAALQRATKASQATRAVFKLAAIFKAEEKNEDVILIIDAYLARWKAEADIAKALFWIGNSKLQMGLVDEAVADYLAAIVEYGADVQQDGVDLMIDDLVKVASLWLDDEKRTGLLDNLQTALETTDDPVLKLRLRVTVALINKTENELGRQLLAELPDFEDVPPPVLSTICKVSVEMKDYSRATELLDIFNTKFEDSDNVREAYKLRSYGLYAEKEYGAALEILDDAQNRFIDDPDMVWAQLTRAQVNLDKGDFAEAITNNLIILGTPAWRGVSQAQATYQLGQVEERIGNPDRAFAYYQRVYYQYKGYAEGYWAAEGYLASARCLKTLGRENDRRNTFRAMLFDPYVNTLPQAAEAREELGAVEVAEIEALMAAGTTTNIIITVEMPEAGTNTTDTAGSEAPMAEPVAAGGGES